jgi:ABC-type transport system involved in multi-copper enzyme maturation permease subunit
MKPILAIASTTVGEAVRRKVLLVIMLVGVLFLGIAPSLGVLSARSETTVLKGMLLGIIQLTSAVIAIVLTVYMIPNEIDRRTIYTILCKPVQRWQFLIGKYLGAVAALGLMMLLMTVVMEATYWGEQQFHTAGMIELLRAPLMFFVQMSLLAAVAIFFSTFVTPLVNFFLSGGVYLVGSLLGPFFQTIEENKSLQLSAKMFALLVNTCLPNFSEFNVQNPIINPQQQIGNTTTYNALTIAHGLVYILGLLIAGIQIFDRREV